jgi:hypothetical protein
MGKDKEEIDNKKVWTIIYNLAAQRRDEPENKHTAPGQRASGEALGTMRALIAAGVPVEIPQEVTATYEPTPVKPVKGEAAAAEPLEPVKVEGTLGKIAGAVAGGLKKVLGIGGEQQEQESKESAKQ